MNKQNDDCGQRRIFLRKAAIMDLELLYKWRNHPKTRDASHNTNEISIAEHERWLKASLLNPDREIYIAVENGCPVGTIRIDRTDETCELSWTVAPECTGRGIGKRIVREVAEKIKGCLRAEVKTGNKASMRIAEYAGLRLENERDGILFYCRDALG